MWSAFGKLIAAMGIAILVWQIPRWFEMALGLPTPDERLLRSAGGEMDGFDAALKDGADINFRDTYGLTPLIEAAATGSPANTERLIELGADVNATDCCGCTALMRATGNNRARIVSLLLRHGAEAGAGDWRGHTALDWAVNSNARDSVAVLAPEVASR